MKIKNYLNGFFLLATGICSTALPGYSQRYSGALSPTESMKTFQIRPGFAVEPFVSEPDVLSPVDIIFDEHGSIYVVEMGDYPYDAEPGKFKGRIRLLKDTNGDGKVDKSYVFADNLPSATSILPWKGGIIVTAAPDILYLKDTDGDNKADVRQVLFTGFFNKNSEAQITSLRYGVDNWIYANNHGQAGSITFSQKTGTTLNVGGGDFRFRLDRGVFESESGSGQFGLALDDWGHRFFTQNTLHIQQAPIAWRYTHRHNFLPSTRSDVNISDHELEMFQKSATPYWRQTRSDRRQAKYDSLKTGYTEWARDHFTGASGATFYGGDGYPKEFYGNIFTGDVSGNLVHRDVLTSVPGKPAYQASRAEGEKSSEFIAATDTWFRPANFYSAPDGYLYVVDMYRQHIETPVSIPEDLKTDMDFANGEQYGRIWRVYPKEGQKRPVEIPVLTNKKTDELIALLSHPNQWWRLTAQRMLVEKQDAASVPVLKKAANEGKDGKGRLHALYTLEGLNALDADMIKKALSDTEPGVREHALVLAEQHPQFVAEISKLTDDASPQVAVQATLSLGQFSGKEVVATLAKVVEKNIENPAFRMAVLSSNAGSSPEFGELIFNNPTLLTTSSYGREKLVSDYAYIVGSRNGKNEINGLLTLLAKKDQKWQEEGLSGLAGGIKRSQNKKDADKATLKTLQKLEDGGSADVKKAVASVKKALGV